MIANFSLVEVFLKKGGIVYGRVNMRDKKVKDRRSERGHKYRQEFITMANNYDHYLRKRYNCIDVKEYIKDRRGRDE